MKQPTKLSTSRQALKVIVGILALIPFSAGIAGVLLGPDFPGFNMDTWPRDLDSHFRFLSGTFVCVGLCFWSCVPDIEVKTSRFRLLCALIFSGGLARLYSLLAIGSPGEGHLLGLTMELVAVPVLVFWQSTVARHHTNR